MRIPECILETLRGSWPVARLVTVGPGGGETAEEIDPPPPPSVQLLWLE